VLVLDAFSGDSIPTHLLTTEAMEIYARHLAPGGVVAAHVSNHFLDLGPVMRGVARKLGMKSVTVELNRTETDPGQSSLWILCTRDAAAFEDLEKYATAIGDPREIPWTDDRHDLFTIFRLR
jgi:spermidine synthase